VQSPVLPTAAFMTFIQQYPLGLFIENAQLEQFLAHRALLAGRDALMADMQLAWHLRQRDSVRALDLCESVEANLAILGTEFDLARWVLYRVFLIRAEILWLQAKFAPAIYTAEFALTAYTDLGDAIGCADSHWLLSSLKYDVGLVNERPKHLEHCIAYADQAADANRVECARARLAAYLILDGSHADTTQLLEKYEGMLNHPCVGLRLFIFNFLGIFAKNRSDCAKATSYFVKAMEAADDSGQCFLSLIALVNVGNCFLDMNDNQAALDWAQRALEFSRRIGWPGSLAEAMRLAGSVFMKLRDLKTAHELLKEALDVLQNQKHTRIYIMTLRKMGELAIEQENYSEALGYFDELVAHPVVQTLPVIASMVLRGRASCLLHLRRDKEALLAANEALRAAREYRFDVNQIDAMLVLVEILKRYPHLHDEQCAQMTPDTPPGLALQLEAITLGRSIPDYIVPADLLESVAREYASLTNHERAYRYALEAIGSREKRHGDDLRKRATALQMRLQTERSLIEAENAKKIAEEQKHRLALLEQQSETLATLGKVGQEITPLLRTADIYDVLSQHVRDLTLADNFSIWLLDESAACLQRAYGIEKGTLLAADIIDMDNFTSHSVRCVRQRHEILVNADDNTILQVSPGTLRMESMIFSPLIVGERVLGLMTVQSMQKHAFQEREVFIFRTICSYGAIALDNARAYGKLKETQKQLVEQEKMAALGGLVAGVAHEINTPLGICVTATSHMQEEVQLSLGELDAGTLSEQSLRELFDTMDQSLRILTNNTARAARLIRSFKQVAVDQSSDEIREFNLQAYLAEVLQSLQPNFRGRKITIECSCDGDILLRNLPGALSQILTNMVVNSLTHGFEGRETGTICITAQIRHGQIELLYADDGAGMDAQSLSKLFEPFFTTRRGQGGSGLGAHIIYNLATSGLGGTISASSQPGEGLRYVMRFPQFRNAGSGNVANAI
jgi:signal transduction histidine kinase/tetratricopeptide (TPR) repeat protein